MGWLILPPAAALRPVRHPTGLILRPAGPSRGSLRENQPAWRVQPV